MVENVVPGPAASIPNITWDLVGNKFLTLTPDLLLEKLWEWSPAVCVLTNQIILMQAKILRTTNLEQSVA